MTVDVHHPDKTESKPLTTELETLAPEATAAYADLSTDSTSTPHATGDAVGSLSASADGEAKPGAGGTAPQGEPDYDAADFAAALANFDREQAAETAAAQNLTAEEVVIAGTVVKLTDKHVVVDIGLKSEGLIPLEQVLDHEGKPKFKAGDAIEVVVEREEPEGGYLASYEKALRHKVWDKLEKAANDKTPVKGLVVSRVKGGLTVDIGVRAFMPASRSGTRDAAEMEKLVGQEIQCRVIKLDTASEDVVVDRRVILEEEEARAREQKFSELKELSLIHI